MLWNYKTFHFSPKMRQMMYPDCKTTLKVESPWTNENISIFHDPVFLLSVMIINSISTELIDFRE